MQSIAADGVMPQPGPEAPRWVTTVAERRDYGWVDIVVALLCCALPIRVLILFLRDWDRVTQPSTPIWVGVGHNGVLRCYGAGISWHFHFLLAGRIRLLEFGGAYWSAAVVTGTTLFAAFD
ncbi:MAG: hypothetical protein OSB03_07235 [Vicinamibacterales bacterium]|nr:hypothetical protein [Vicinamibacterales bacterium]